MKKLLFIAVLGFMTAVQVNGQTELANPQQTEITKGPIMHFESLVVDYGEIEQHSEPLRVATFVNTGTEPLIIESARGSCGCTVPSYAKEPILPGESSKIEIRYATDRLGKINKTVTLTTNQGGDPIVLKVVGNVSPVDHAEGLPEAPVSIIKSEKN